MKRALFISKNLIGDALNISPALRAWHAGHQDWKISLLTLPDQVAPLYYRMGVPLTVVTENQEPEFDFIFNFHCGVAFAIGQRFGMHITQCYGQMLGVEIESRCPVYEPLEEDHEVDLVLVSLFSKSCSSQKGGQPPNKMLPWDKAAKLIEMLRQVGKIGILAADDDDRVPIFRDSRYNIVENEYYRGLSLNKVALMLRDCKMLLTIDNGIAHLAATQQTRSLVLYPACLSQTWIAPIGNKNATIVQMNPVTVPLIGLMHLLRETAVKWGILE